MPGEPLGIGAGVSDALENILAQRRAEELMRQKGLETFMGLQAQRDWRETQNQAREDAIAQRREAASEAARIRGEAQTDRAIGQMAPGDILPSDRYNQLETAGGAAFPVTRFQRIDAEPALPEDFQGPLQSGDTRAGHPAGMRFLGTQGQLQKIQEDSDKNQRQSDLNDLRKEIADNANETRLQIAGMRGDQGRKPSFQEVDAASNMNSAEIQAVKVLRHLHESGLDQSNDPTDPRWQTFLAQDMKVRPIDEAKADAIQRTQYVKAVLGRAIMGGRPSQYVMQMIEQHLPDSKMSGKQLAGVINDVLDEVRTKRLNMENFYGGDEAKRLEPVGGETYSDFVGSLATEANKRKQSQSGLPPGVTVTVR